MTKLLAVAVALAVLGCGEAPPTGPSTLSMHGISVHGQEPSTVGYDRLPSPSARRR